MNGLKLPEAFVKLIDRSQPLDYWVPKDEYGAPVRQYRPDLMLMDSLVKVEEETARLPASFHIADYTPEEIAKGNAEAAHLPSWIPFITDSAEIVYFGRTPSGSLLP